MPTWLIVIAITLVVVGSVAWVRPSQRDKRLAEFRHEALMAGLKVRLDGIEAEPKESGIREDIPGASYILIEKQPVKKDATSWMVVKDDGWIKDGLVEGWSWHTKKVEVNLETVNSLIESAPVPILGIERTPKFSRIIWGEGPVEFNGTELKQYLEKVQALC